MTNQQGAPEALRTITRYEVVDCIDSKHVPAVIPNKDGPWVLYEDHLAALVEAQQPATHVQQSAEIEHVAGDVSKNGAESNMVQQPAPSAAATLWQIMAAAKALHATSGSTDEWAELRQWDVDAYRQRAEQIVAAVLPTAPQPSPTPQADSQPAPVNTGQIAECYGDCPTDPKTCANPCKFDGRAARAPADSVTAPAGGMDDDVDAIALARYKVVPAHESMFHRFAVVAGDGKQQLYLGREIECANMARKFAGAFLDGAFYQANIAPTQPAQAAGSVLEDAARYRWLADMNDWYGEPRLDETDGTKWQLTFYSPQRIEDAMDDDSLDAAVDAARKQGGAT